MMTNAMQSGGGLGMQSLDSNLRRFLDAKLITGDQAYSKAVNKPDFASLREQEASI